MAATLDLDAVEIRAGPLVLVSDAEVDDLETRIGSKVPGGYREYVTRLGEGILSDFVRVLPPWRILADLDEHRGRMAAYWFWDDSSAPFGQEQAMASIPVADTTDGDAIAFHPSEPDQLVVLPRSEDSLYLRGPGLLATIEWVCSGRIGQLGPHRSFVPFDGRAAQVNADLSIDGQPVAVAASGGEPSLPWHATEPDLRRPPRDVLLAYFAELRAVEAMGTELAGGPAAFTGDRPPELDGLEKLVGWSEEIAARYCTPTLALGLRGASIAVSSTPEHALDAIRIVDERTERAGRVVIRVGIGHDLVFEHQYTLEESDGEWRIAVHREVGILQA